VSKKKETETETLLEQSREAALLLESMHFVELEKYLKKFSEEKGITIVLSAEGPQITKHIALGGSTSTLVGLIETHRACLRAEVIHHWRANKLEANAQAVAETGVAHGQTN